MKKLQIHQAAWLSKHPERTEAWLRERLKDGFHIHHIDCNHFNNDPDNLVLIDELDHLVTLHNRGIFTKKKIYKRKKPRLKKRIIVIHPKPEKTIGYWITRNGRLQMSLLDERKS